jgi:AraC-like DNA-binding protein
VEVKVPRKKFDIPLIRASIVLTFLNRLNERQELAVLERLGMSRETVTDAARFLSAEEVYTVVEWCAVETGNTFFGIETGLALDIATWPPFLDAMSTRTLAEFISKYSAGVASHATSTKYILELGSPSCTWRQTRTFRPNMLPAQADAFAIGLMVNILMTALGPIWNRRQVSLQMCAPSTCKTQQIAGMDILQGGKMGVACIFPTHWLWAECDFGAPAYSGTEFPESILPTDLSEVVEHLLKANLPITHLNTARLAEAIGTTPRSLRSRLRAKGTNFASILEDVKCRRAVDLLKNNDVSVAHIAGELGYTDAANFTRAFRRLTGMTPRSFRKSKN